MMHLDDPELVVSADPAKRPDEIPWLKGQAAALGEYQARVLRGRPERFPVSGLLLLARYERCASQLDDG
jgi:hypothetical protein